MANSFVLHVSAGNSLQKVEELVVEKEGALR